MWGDIDRSIYPASSPHPSAARFATFLINRPEIPSLGGGEPAIIPVPAAIANAVFDATGVRLREAPFTPERVWAGLKSLSPQQKA